MTIYNINYFITRLIIKGVDGLVPGSIGDPSSVQHLGNIIQFT